MTLRFQLEVGDGKAPALRMLAARSWTVGEPGFLGLPASGNTCNSDERASGPCAMARGQDTDGEDRPPALAAMPSLAGRASLLELLGMPTPLCHAASNAPQTQRYRQMAA
jgi:hypothetical protein